MNVETLYRSQKEEAIDVLCEAFRDYPVMRVTLEDAGNAYEQHLRAMIDSFCENRLTRGQPLHGIRKGGEAVAIAVVSRPVRIPPTAEMRAIHARLDELLGANAVERLRQYDLLCEAGKPDRPHHYLGMLGVRLDHQSCGCGRALVDHIKRRVQEDNQSEGICLNTERESNVPIYKRLGFEVIHEAENERLHTWCMFWECT